MSNIYGEASSQHFDKVDLLKMKFAINRKAASVRYVDVPNEPSSQSQIPSQAHALRPHTQRFSLEGGSKRSLTGGKDIKVVSSPDRIQDKDLQKFIHTFHLSHLFANIHSNTLIVIPSSKTLNELENDFVSKLKGEGITDVDSKEASLFAARCETLKFKNYIFDVYGRESNDNEGFEYRLDPEYPTASVDVTLRRTNRANNVYFWHIVGDKVEVSASKKLTKPTSLELFGKCDRAVFIFRGDLPAPEGDKLKSTSNVITASLSGGAKRAANLNLRKYFNRLLQKYDNDIYAAADEFVPKVALAEVARTGNVKAIASKVANYCSADLVHSAMSILFADGDDDGFDMVDVDDLDDFDAEDTNSMVDEIINNYTPKTKSINMKTALEAIKTLYDKSTTAHNAFEASKQFVNDVFKVYGKFPPSLFKADVATAMLSTRRVNDGTMNYIYSVVDSMNDLITKSNHTSTSTNPLFKEQMSTRNGVVSALTAAIFNAYNARPFIGVVAKCGIPMFSKKKCGRRVIKKGSGGSSKKGSGKGKKRVGKKAFEDNESLDIDAKEEQSMFKLIDDYNASAAPKKGLKAVQDDDSDTDTEGGENEGGSDDSGDEKVDANAPKEAEDMLNSFLVD